MDHHQEQLLDLLEMRAFRLLLKNDDDDDSLNLTLNSLFEELSLRVSKSNIMDDQFHQPLRLLSSIVKFPKAARALVNHPNWSPKGFENGLNFEKMSLLGPFLHLSALPDDRFKNQLRLSKLLPSDVISGQSEAGADFSITVKRHMNELHGGLEQLLLSLLNNCDTHEKVFEYIAEIIKQNSSMTNIQANPNCASAGMFVNLSAVMLRLCKTFLDKDLIKRGEIDAKYVFYNTFLDLSKMTSLHASSEAVAVWIEHGHTNGSSLMSLSGGASSSDSNRVEAKRTATSSSKTKYTFVCESFFITARVLHLGLLKALSDMEHVHKRLATCKSTLSTLKMMREHGSHRHLKQKIKLYEIGFEMQWRKFYCYLSQIIQDEAFLQQALSFYRLLVVWLIDLAGGCKMPLPSNCPMEFACIPEHFVDDVLELVTIALTHSEELGQIFPVMDEFMNFVIMFMASPNYIRNSNLREKMVELLFWCMRRRSYSASTMTIFEDNQLCLDYLVPNLLQLYISDDFTGFKQYGFRNNIIEILEYLWKIPSHYNAWRKTAEDMEFYLVFLSFAINEIMLVFSKCLHRILALEEMEAEMSNSVEWKRISFQEKLKKDLNMHNKMESIGYDMSYVIANVGLLAFTSEQIIAPLLLPQMVDIVATMLNYILLHVLGLQGKSLRQPTRHKYRLDILLNKIVSIYVHLARGDKEDIFPAAISKDSQSYNPQLFTDAVEHVLHEDISMIQEFVELGNRATFAASKTMDTEAALGEIPKDFLDPIETDPFNALPLTKDMIVPNVELKAKIDEFIRSKLK